MRKVLLTTLLIFTAVYLLTAQTPEHYPPPVPEPVTLSLFNIILYVVVPIALLVFLLYYRRKKRKERNRDSQNN